MSRRRRNVQQLPPPPQSGQQFAPQMPQVTPKLSISDAIALISLRLGRAENIIQNMEANNGIIASNNEVIDSLIERITILEKRLEEPSDNEQITNAIDYLNEELANIKENMMVSLQPTNHTSGEMLPQHTQVSEEEEEEEAEVNEQEDEEEDNDEDDN